jgi:hypothetical protein
MKPPVVMSNVDRDDMLFHNDIGSWNVTRAIRDCRAGKHEQYIEHVEAVWENNAAIEFDEAKVVAIMAAMKASDQYVPLIAVMEGGAIWLIDGRHRLEALHRLGVKQLIWYVIEEADAAPYRVLYNGERKPPFKPY